ncbi:type I polyketide synthase [Stackebrandtia nassauensis]|uniref:Beta-ketoacyl synthase n=1 Tax=Stackebrandtia nassauensis (strain DSM 44728 / CIP 108903 / NRRL B-16338 / NBRC 102104 / LLR-40K-21) TaxID=446470 RepID=D3Q1R4_STANL|nr:type I polyketide synthase [Stackebrandtia nassauensis]ADD39912.1 Beta-ketoacyl synthase [Stackebrandtia nassauensis DSM 44728]
MTDRVAIVGAAIRTAGAVDTAGFWRLLADGRGGRREFDRAELERRGVPGVRFADPRFVPVSFPLANPAGFDAAAFAISPAEAELMDPQHRAMLESAYRAVESSGHHIASLADTVGVYVGARPGLHAVLLRATGADIDETKLVTGSYSDYLAARLSYTFGLGGPTISVQTTCSTSAVAIHLAVQAILAGECDSAVAGGVAIDIEDAGYLCPEGGVFSPRGRCQPFTTTADGTVDGNGVASVFLRRLDLALADGDPILAVVAGTAVNNDGRDRVGFTAPSVSGQSSVIGEALDVAELTPDHIGLFETHGTGTSVGDPLEIEAATLAYREAGMTGDGLRLGTIKANIGHLTSAAGAAGVIASLLALRNEAIPPNLPLTEGASAIDLSHTPFRLTDRLEPWRRGPEPRFAAISSFGLGGTNAHIILGDPDEVARRGARRSWQVLPLSADDAQRLTETVTATRQAASEATSDERHDLGHTLRLGRPELAVRAVAMLPVEDAATATEAEHEAADMAASAAQCAAAVEGRTAPAAAEGQAASTAGQGSAVAKAERETADMAASAAQGAAAVEGQAATATTAVWPTASSFRSPSAEPPSLVYLLPGQGGRSSAAAHQLYQSEPWFTATVDTGLDIVEDVADPRTFARVRNAFVLGTLTDDTEVAQPVLHLLAAGVATVLERLGIQPTALAGHSVAEITAAQLAGVLDFAEATTAVCHRGAAMAAMPPGEMYAVRATPALLADLPDGTEISVRNTPSSTVLSTTAGEPLRNWLDARALRYRRLGTSHAFHHASMADAAEAFTKRMRGISLRPPRIPLLSCPTGTWLEASQATDPVYWGRQLREPVDFVSGLRAVVAAHPNAVPVQLGAGTHLLAAIREAVPMRPNAGTPVIRETTADTGIAMLPDGDARMTLPAAIGALWQHGVPVDWNAYAEHDRGLRTAAPPRPLLTTPVLHPALRGRTPGIDPSDLDNTPAPATPSPEAEDVPLLGPVCECWAETLGAMPAPDDDFFASGGDSIAAGQIVARLRSRFDVAIPVHLPLVATSPRELARAVDELLIAAVLQD